MGVELVVLYAIYAIAGATVVGTTVDTVGEVMVESKKANKEKYVACQQNPKNDATLCKDLE